MKRILIFWLTVLLLSSCTADVAPLPDIAAEPSAEETPAATEEISDETTPETVTESSAAETDAETITETAPAPLAYTEEELMKILGLSVTEGGLSTTRDAIFTRFAEYKALGITCIRIDTAWDTSVQGKWTMQASTKNYLEAAKEHGLLLKLILPTVMAPPSWLSADADTRLMDYNGRRSINTVSYWYDGITEYCDTAVRAMLDALVQGGYADVIGAVVVDMGPAGEPLYPPAWTQASNGLDNSDNGEEVMWCYADNAQADFRVKMTEKYGTIGAANEAWGTDYVDFDSVEVPKPDTVKGTFWEDTLVWYRDAKRTFMAQQVATFKTALADAGLSDRRMILYLPGADYTETQWKGSIRNGSASYEIKIGCDNEYAVQLAAEQGCWLQYTGINDTARLAMLREYMYENGYGAIPVFGENAGDQGSASNPNALTQTITGQHLAGIDYTHTRWLYEDDGTTHSRIYTAWEKLIPTLAEYLETVDISAVPEELSE